MICRRDNIYLREVLESKNRENGEEEIIKEIMEEIKIFRLKGVVNC